MNLLYLNIKNLNYLLKFVQNVGKLSQLIIHFFLLTRVVKMVGILYVKNAATERRSELNELDVSGKGETGP